MTDQLKKALIIVALLTVGLCVLPFALEPATVAWLASEEGPIEQGSVWLWFVAGALLLGRNLRVRRLLPMAFALVMLLMGVREVGLPAEWFPSGGKALMSWRYYANDEIDGMRRLLTGLTIVTLLLALITCVVSTIRHIFARGGWRYADGQLLMLAFACLVLGQLFESGVGSDVASTSNMVFWVLEEGYEAMGPLFALMACMLPKAWFILPKAR